MSKQWKKNCIYEHYECLGDFGREAVRVYQKHGKRTDRPDKWAGGSMQEAADLAARGDTPQNVAQVEAFVEQIELAYPLTMGLKRWGTEIAGYVPHVPNAVIGLPDAMLAPTISEAGPSGPITICVGIGCSAFWEAEAMRNRGAAIAALAVKMSQVRPVRLLLYAALSPMHETHKATVITVDLGVAPLNLATVTAGLANVATFRKLAFAVAKDRHAWESPVNWPWRSYTKPELLEKRVREIAGLSPEDLFIHEARMEDKLVTRPVEWVAEQLAKHTPELV